MMASKLDSSTFSCFRNCENVEVPLAAASGDLRSSLHKAGEGGEGLADVTGMFEAVIIMLSVALVSHHLGQSERCQHIAHARYASADSAGDLAGS